MTPSASGASASGTKQTKRPSLATYIGSSPRISHAPRTASLTGTDRSSTSIASLAGLGQLDQGRREAPPREVAQAMHLETRRQERPDGAASGAQSLSMGLSKANPSRTAMIAIPWRPTSPLRITASPTLICAGPMLRSCSIRPMPAVVT